MKNQNLETVSQYMKTWDTKELEDAFLVFCVDTLESEGKITPDVYYVISLVDESWFFDSKRKAVYFVLRKIVLESSGNIVLLPGSISAKTEALLSFKNIEFDSGEIAELLEIARGSSPLFLGCYSIDLLVNSVIPLWRLKLARSQLLSSVDTFSDLLVKDPTPSLFTDTIPKLLETQQSIWNSASSVVKKAAGWNDTINELLQPLPKENSISTGIGILDATIQGGIAGAKSAYAGRLIVVAARPGMGKTTFAITLATHLATSENDVAFFSLEMPRKQIEYKSISCKDFLDQRETGKIIDPIRVFNLQQRTCSPPQRDKIKSMLDSSFVKKFKIFDASETASSIASKIRLLTRTRPGLRAIFVDYLQLIDDCRGDGKTSEASAIGVVTQSLKRLAIESGIDIFLLSQVNRGVENRTEKMPGLADLRASGRIEEDADIVMFLYRPGYYSQDHDQYELAISVAKNRGGVTGILPCKIDLASSVVFDRL